MSNYYRKFNLISNNNSIKISLKKRFHHQRYPTISSVQYAILNNYKIICSKQKKKKGSNHKTLSYNLNKNFLTNNTRNIIHYKKMSLNINHNNERKINSFVNRTENAINNSDTFENIKYQKWENY